MHSNKQKQIDVLEAGDIAAYGMATSEHIIYEPGTEATDAFSG